jgi:ParB-like chromosome segregation protein Spo0J
MREAMKAKAAPPLLEHVRLPLASVVVNPRNNRRHPPEQIARLAASLRKNGQPREILLRRANRMIIAGHGVAEACRVAGIDQINAMLWNVDQKSADAFMLGDNRLAELGREDVEATRRLLRELNVDEPEALGYSPVEIAKLLGETIETIAVVEVATGTVEDRFWISIRGPLRDQAKTLNRLTRAMQDLPNVDVMLGTVADGSP